MAKKKETRGRKPTGVTPKRYFRMADSDYEIVKNAAASCGITVSEYIRAKLLEKPHKLKRNK